MPVLLRLAYVGARLHGCPEQPGRRTVLGELRAALARIGQGDAALDVASRTDAGVHAWAQVARVDMTLPPGAALRALDRHLPDDLRALAAASGTSLRARRKTYTYLIDQSMWGDPGLAWCAWRPPSTPDPALVRAALDRLGAHEDWSVARRAGETRRDLRRPLDAWAVDARGDALRIHLTAAAFTYHLARTLVGAAVAVGRGALTLDRLSATLDRGGPLVDQAPARGLHLTALDLEEEPAWEGAGGLTLAPALLGPPRG